MYPSHLWGDSQQARQLSGGGPERTRISDLYRVKVVVLCQLIGFIEGLRRLVVLKPKGRPFIAAISQRSFNCRDDVTFLDRGRSELLREGLRRGRPRTGNLVALRLPSFLGGTLRWKVVLGLETK
jgi:hypothetical protein